VSAIKIATLFDELFINRPGRVTAEFLLRVLPLAATSPVNFPRLASPAEKGSAPRRSSSNRAISDRCIDDAKSGRPGAAAVILIVALTPSASPELRTSSLRTEASYCAQREVRRVPDWRKAHGRIVPREIALEEWVPEFASRGIE